MHTNIFYIPKEMEGNSPVTVEMAGLLLGRAGEVDYHIW
jgi:hypothetical protein